MTVRRRRGFTLIEMLAVVVLTTLVLSVAITFFIDLSRASSESVDHMRAGRRATALLDRLARDLEGTYLVKKPKATDPLEHPWLFLAESSAGGPGADRLKFMTRTASPRTSEGHESDVSVVAYAARPAADGGIEVLRWSEPQLPKGLDRSIAADEGAGALVLASGIASFGVRLLDESGTWQSAWDSSQLTDSSELPIAAEIEVSMLPPPSATAAPSTAAGAASEPPAFGPFVRRVLIPIRPIDLEALLHPEETAAAAEGEDEKKKDGKDSKDEDSSQQASADKKQDEKCMTVAQCLSINPGVVQQFPQIQGILSAIGGQCFRDFSANIPPGLNLVGCR
jgi:prepilin-type N-terminal cleavage/methylation domain-containing protein